MKDSQYYSKIAKQYLEELSANAGVKFTMICYGNLDDMEELAIRFGAPREKYRKKVIEEGYGIGYVHRKCFQYVLNKLDVESQRSDALFEKGYICYNGIINRPTRCFTLKEK